MLNDFQFEETTRISKDFRSGIGRKIQRELFDRVKKNPNANYVSKMWFDMYLNDRRPVVLTHSPVVMLKDSKLGAGYSNVC